MPRNRRRKAKQTAPEPEWLMYPSLHDQINENLSQHRIQFEFHDQDDDDTPIKSYDTHVTGFFPCENQSCKSPGWPSGHVAIHIRQYPGRRYNARVYFQRCRRCKKINQVELDKDSYVERVSYRLKVWNGVSVPRPRYNEKTTKPHLEGLCLGCKNGHCAEGLKWSRRTDDD